MKLTTYDCGYGIVLLVKRRMFRVHLPFPITRAAWRYLIRCRRGR